MTGKGSGRSSYRPTAIWGWGRPPRGFLHSPMALQEPPEPLKPLGHSQACQRQGSFRGDPDKEDKPGLLEVFLIHMASTGEPTWAWKSKLLLTWGPNTSLLETVVLLPWTSTSPASALLQREAGRHKFSLLCNSVHNWPYAPWIHSADEEQKSKPRCLTHFNIRYLKIFGNYN